MGVEREVSSIRILCFWCVDLGGKWCSFLG